ncbi:PLP-dependent aminotransferase family protein [Sporolactobacillus sp. THM7-4]|nr:PLP-dependent aminotransferase family protein [Sporolactobacillus sp. THM7-4]
MENLAAFSFSKRLADIPVVGSAFEGDHPDLIPLAYGFPAPESFPIQKMADAAVSALYSQGREALQYSGGPGQRRVLQWIKERSRLRSIDVEEDNILVTSGSSQGIDLVARTLTDPGDHVWVEAPTFFGALRSFRLADAQLTAFPIDENGLRVDLVEEALIKAKKNHQSLPKFIYVLPNYQNPTGVNLSVERRKKLAELACEYNFYILEDDAYVELNYDGPFQPSIYSFAPRRVIYLSTFSKIIAPGIRMAWAIADKEVLDKMRIMKPDGLTSVFVQEVISNFLDKVDFESHRRKLVDCYRPRRDAMVAAIRDFFQDEVSFTETRGGFFLWLTFSPEVDTSELLNVAVEKGVSYVDGRHFFLEERPSNQLRLAFSFCNEEEIRNGIGKIAEAYFEKKKVAK